MEYRFIFLIYLKLNPCTDLVSIFVEVSLRRERIPLLVVEVLLQVEERVKEDGGHAAPFQVAHGYSVMILGYDHVQHLEGEIQFDGIIKKERESGKQAFAVALGKPT